MGTYLHDKETYILVEGPSGYEEKTVYYTVVEVYEPNWGADADGNRGVVRHYFEEPEIDWEDTQLHEGYADDAYEAVRLAVESLQFELRG